MRAAGGGGVTSTRAALQLLLAEPTDPVGGLAVTRTGRPAGSAPTVLLVHGVGASRAVWAPVLPALAERYHVLALDLPGHGRSAPLAPGDDAGARALAARVAQACAELGEPHPHVVGNSFGGWVGLELAADGVAASLTALAPAGLRLVPRTPSPVLRVNRALARATGPLAEPLLAVTAVRRLVFASGSADPARLDVEVARAVAADLRRSTGYEAVLATTAHARFERRADISVPVTIVFGDRDRILPAPGNQQRRLAPAGCRWLTLSRCGHAPMWDCPQTTVRLIRETIARATTPHPA